MPIDNQPLPGMKPGAETGTPMQATPPAPLKSPKKDKLKLEKPAKNLKDIIKINPPLIVKEEDKSKSKHSVMAFGRMNPPHAGHQHVVDKVADVAKKVGAKRGRVVVSHSHDKKKNPLDQKSRMDYIKKMNPSNKVRGSSKEHPNFLSYAKKLHKKGTTDLHVVTGSDRADEFKKTLDKYNNHPDHYSFKSINVHSAGDKRDDKSKTTSGASGTKQREYAKKGDYKSFSKNLPKNLQKDGEGMYKKMREWNEGDWDDLILEMDQMTDNDLQLIVDNDIDTEEIINERVMNLMQRRRAALKMRRMKFRIARARKIKAKRFATMDMLTRRARRQARNFIRKRIAGKQGEKYVDLSPSQKMAIDKRMQKKLPFINKMAKRLMPKVKQAELVRLRAARNRKESYINSSFGSLITELQTDWSSDYYSDEQLQENGDKTAAGTNEAADPAVKAKTDALKDKHTNETESQKKRHAIEREKLTAQNARNAQAQIRREAHEVSEVVDVMVDALAALDLKAQKANVELDTLFVEFVEGYQNPHGKQTPQQGGFAAVNRLIAEMSAVEKDKAEDIVKGMKKKASNFRKLYGKDAKSVMYATANKMAQEDMQKFRKDILQNEIQEGGWKGWARFNKNQGKDLEKRLSKGRKAQKSKSHQFGKFGDIDDPAIGEGTYANFSKRRAAQLTPKEKDKANANYKQKARDDIKKKQLARAYGIKEGKKLSEIVSPLALKAAGAAAKYAAPKIAGAAATAAAPYVAGAAAAYGAKKYIQKKMKDKRDEKIATKAVDKYVQKQKDMASEGMGAAYMPDAEKMKTAEREITSKAVMKQLNRNRNRGAMKGKVRTPNVRYVHDRQRETDMTATHRGKTVINPEGKKKGNRGKGSTNDSMSHKTAGKKAKTPQSRKRKARKKD